MLSFFNYSIYLSILAGVSTAILIFLRWHAVPGILTRASPSVKPFEPFCQAVGWRDTKGGLSLSSAHVALRRLELVSGKDEAGTAHSTT